MNHILGIAKASTRLALLTPIGVIVLGLSGPALAQEHPAGAIAADSIQWGPAPPTVPKGAEMAVLSGDPSKEGPFTLRLKVPGGYKIAAHSHPTYEAVTVISGMMNFGMGDKLDESKATQLAAGGFIDLPAEMNHFAFSSEESIVQIHSTGPFGIKYVNPADDPSKTQ
jgi:quercetin dioxygenase-like cupin family protein